MPSDTLVQSTPLVDERALVRTLKTLREIVEEEHLLELDKAAAVPPLQFLAATPTSASGRACLFRTDPSREPSGVRGPSLQSGDSVDITLGDGRSAIASGTIASVSAEGVLVEFTRPVEGARMPQRGAIRLRVDDNQHTLRLRAVETLVRERHALPWVGPVLANGQVDALSDEHPSLAPELTTLTDAQRRAIDGASRSQDVFLIQGPPGTGKTTVISALVKHFAEERGLRVLLTSKGHRAIDNALDRLASTPNLHVIRLGQAGKVTGVGQEILLSAVLAQAEQEIPRRHQAGRAGLEAAARLLETADQSLTRIVAVDRGIAEAEAAIRRREAEIDAAFAARLAAIQAEAAQTAERLQAVRLAEEHPVEEPTPGPRRLLDRFARPIASARQWLNARSDPSGVRRLEQRLVQCQEAEDWVHQSRRYYLVRQDLVALREHLARLREDRYRLGLESDAVFAALRDAPTTSTLPRLAATTLQQAIESLEVVRTAARRVKLALDASLAWSATVERPGALAEILVGSADVVAATAVGVASGRDGARTAALDYDVAIVDEAGQAQAADLVVALSRARRVILVGDHKQLAPFVDEDLLRRCQEKHVDTTWLEKSLFELLWDRLPESHRVRLNTQFRMPEPIATFLGQVFYEGDYYSAEGKHGLAPVAPLFNAPFVFVDTSAIPARAETALTPGYLNQYEAQIVARLVQRMWSAFSEPEGLGVIAPYGAQVTAIRRQLGDALQLSPRDPWLVDNVATVDSFQGQERDVVIVSLTRSNASGQVGFLSDLNRLNVTLSRARRQLVVIGDVSTLTAQGGSPERRAFANFARDFAWRAKQHGELIAAEDFEQRLARA